MVTLNEYLELHKDDSIETILDQFTVEEQARFAMAVLTSPCPHLASGLFTGIVAMKYIAEKKSLAELESLFSKKSI